MYYLQSRFYNPHSGRFLNADQLFDTDTGLLGTNMFAYCDNNPVNRIDQQGKWGTDVHIGGSGSLPETIKILICGPQATPAINEERGIYYGTIQWARDVDFGEDDAISIAYGNWNMADAVLRVLQLVVTQPAMSWHANTNMGTLLPDSRDIRMYETLVCLETLKLFELAKCLEDKPLAKESHKLALWELGIATHPAQDKHGHADYFVLPKYSFVGNIVYGSIRGEGDGDNVKQELGPIDGITYYHWDNLIRSRNETYNILGRFHMKYMRG